MSGPLAGTRVVEINAMGPVPFCGQLLSDLGADIIRVDRPAARWASGVMADPNDVSARGRRSVAVDLKRPEGVEIVLRLVEEADALIEGFRPGVVERLGIGPDACLARNQRLVYGRCSGWGRTGPMADVAGHDLNFIALAGVLSLVGAPGTPPPPLLGLTGDHGGGGMLLTVGVLAGIVESRRSGLGQVVDTSILEGAAALTTPYHESLALGSRTDQRWSFPPDGWAPFCNTYETSDGKYVAVCAVEPEFYAELLDVLGIEDAPDQDDTTTWPAMKSRFAERFATKSRDEWCALAEGRDACLAPVLSLSEVPLHPHHIARGSFVDIDGEIQPAPAPSFSRTGLTVPARRPRRGEHTRSATLDWGLDEATVERLIESKVLVAD